MTLDEPLLETSSRRPRPAVVGAGLLGLLLVAAVVAPQVSTPQPVPQELEALAAAPGRRVFLHIADTHADPFYDYTQYFKAAPKISRDPALFSNKKPAENCGAETSVEGILENWRTGTMGKGGGPACPCGQAGANPPFQVIDSLYHAIQSQNPEFVIWSGDFASHYEPGTNPKDSCVTARNSAKATVTTVNARIGTRGGKIQHLWGWGNNDVLPKREPMHQDWLEDFGQHLLLEGWLRPEEMETWNAGGFYRRDLGKGLCVLVLNSNSWTANQINEDHHKAQLKWMQTQAFADPACTEYLLNAHVPLGWLEGGQGHHVWENLRGAEVPEYSKQYREILDQHSKSIVAELYGHINKADIRLMGSKEGPKDEPQTIDEPLEKKDGTEEDEEVSIAGSGDTIGDLDEDIDGDRSVVSFTVAGISRRGMNDPQFQRVTLAADQHHGITDIDVFSLKRDACGPDGFTFAYSFKNLFAPHFDHGINVQSLKEFVQDKTMRANVESHLALTANPYSKKDFKNDDFLEEVRAGKTGC